MYYTRLDFNSIYVLESLPPGEKKTGTDLYDEVIYPGTRQHDGLVTQYWRVNDTQAFFAKLLEIRDAARQANHRPIIHIEAHGNDDGIELGDGTFVGWKQITPTLRDINQASRMNLLVMVMACSGWNLTAHLMPEERAPVFMVIGPPSGIKAPDILDATRRFYATIVDRLDLTEALSAMNNNRTYDNWQFKPATAAILYCRVFRIFWKDFSDPLTRQARENELVARLVRTHGLDVLQSAVRREAIRDDLKGQRWWYDYLRRRFLMLDIFPEEEKRIGMRFEECYPSHSAD